MNAKLEAEGETTKVKRKAEREASPPSLKVREKSEGQTERREKSLK